MRVATTLALVLALALALPMPARAAAPLHALLPQSVRSARVLTIGSDLDHRPIDFVGAGGLASGMDADLARALGRKLGVSVRFVDTPFDTLLPGLEAQRYDAVMSAMRVTPERLRQANFIDYFLTWDDIVVRAGNPEKVHGMDDLCGKPISMEHRISRRQIIIKASLGCVIGHRGAIEELTPSKGSMALELLRNGRSVAYISDFPMASYNARTSHGAFELVGRRFDVSAYGIGVRKDDAALLRALQGALRAVIADGEYARILRNWMVSAGALTTANVER
ncbi:ABC transporter substrate-binding protein [bacterium]|nr:MAG: ABC transporter substrate-binding protein [bacterium]